MITERPPEIPAPPEGWIYFQGPIPSLLLEDTYTDLTMWRSSEMHWRRSFLNGSSPSHYAVLAGSPTAIRIGLPQAPQAAPSTTNMDQPPDIPPLPEGYIYAKGPLDKHLPGRARETMLVWKRRLKTEAWEWIEDSLNGQSNLHYGVPEGGPMALVNGLVAKPKKPEKPKTLKQLLEPIGKTRLIHVFTEDFKVQETEGGTLMAKGLLKKAHQIILNQSNVRARINNAWVGVVKNETCQILRNTTSDQYLYATRRVMEDSKIAEVIRKTHDGHGIQVLVLIPRNFGSDTKVIERTLPVSILVKTKILIV